MRVPLSGPKSTERRERIERLRKALLVPERIPLHRREDECTDKRNAPLGAENRNSRAR